MATSTVKMMPLDKVRWRLALVWFPLGGILITLLIAQSLAGVYGDELQRVWGWALPNFVPTLALMVSVFAADALNQQAGNSIQVRRNFYILAIGLSIFYLAIFSLSILVQPLMQLLNPGASADVHARIVLMEKSNIWLGPIQGLVIASIGVLFFLREKDQAFGVDGIDHDRNPESKETT